MAVKREFWREASEGISLGDYPEINEEEIKFPHEIYVTYAVSVKECGFNEFIVDGGTQICYYCGKTMFRTAVRRYILAPDVENTQPSSDDLEVE